jgi:hypothetical protein
MHDHVPSPSIVEFTIILVDRTCEILVESCQIIVQPHPPFFALPAIEAAAGDRPVIMELTVICFPIQMMTIAVAAMSDEIRPAKFPPDDPLLHILPREREGELAAYRSADTQSALTVNLGLLGEDILIAFRLLVHQPEAALGKPAH